MCERTTWGQPPRLSGERLALLYGARYYSPQSLSIHPEGVEFLKACGTIALFLGLIVLRFTRLLDPVFGWIFLRPIEYVATVFEPPNNKLDRHRKRLGRGTARLTPKQLRKGPTAQDKRVTVFDWFAGFLAAYALVDWLAIPEAYTLGPSRRLPVLFLLFVTGTILIFVGSATWDEKIGWKKWTFWTSLSATLTISALLTRWAGSFNLNRLLLVLLLSALTFLWTFGMLRRIDRNRLVGNDVLRSPTDK